MFFYSLAMRNAFISEQTILPILYGRDGREEGEGAKQVKGGWVGLDFSH